MIALKSVRHSTRDINKTKRGKDGADYKLGIKLRGEGGHPRIRKEGRKPEVTRRRGSSPTIHAAILIHATRAISST